MNCKRLLACLALISTLFVTACGGGGGGGGSTGGGNNTPQPTTAVVKISTSGSLPAGTQIGGVDVTLNLPAGVAVASSPDSGNPAVLVTNAGKVAASGVAVGANTNTLSTYVSASNAAQVIIHVANPNGFAVGEFVTVNCDISAGHNPVVSDFSVTGFHAVDLYGVGITVLGTSLNANFQ